MSEHKPTKSECAHCGSKKVAHTLEYSGASSPCVVGARGINLGAIKGDVKEFLKKLMPTFFVNLCGDCFEQGHRPIVAHGAWTGTSTILGWEKVEVNS